MNANTNANSTATGAPAEAQAQAPSNAAITVSNMNTYVNEFMKDDIESFKESGNIKSGYENIDAYTNIYPGLYVIGGISSLGKTTFIQQMGDQMAKNGEFIIYFSLEQSTLELASKSLSRIMGRYDTYNALTSLQIRKSDLNDKRIQEAISQYKKFANYITVVECSFRASMDDIEKFVNDYIKTRGIKPVVILDYLQVIQSPDDKKMTTKDQVDSNVRRLKQLQSDNKLVLLLISSLNRANYNSQVDYESFKETGGIEYTADVIWGLQLQILNDDDFDKASINEKREKVRAAKDDNPRKIELVCLKNRFGRSNYSCLFNYYPQFDLFKPDMDGIQVPEPDRMELFRERDNSY